MYSAARKRQKKAKNDACQQLCCRVGATIVRLHQNLTPCLAAGFAHVTVLGLAQHVGTMLKVSNATPYTAPVLGLASLMVASSVSGLLPPSPVPFASTLLYFRKYIK